MKRNKALSLFFCTGLIPLMTLWFGDPNSRVIFRRGVFCFVPKGYAGQILILRWNMRHGIVSGMAHGSWNLSNSIGNRGMLFLTSNTWTM